MTWWRLLSVCSLRMIHMIELKTDILEVLITTIYNLYQVVSSGLYHYMYHYDWEEWRWDVIEQVQWESIRCAHCLTQFRQRMKVRKEANYHSNVSTLISSVSTILLTIIVSQHLRSPSMRCSDIQVTSSNNQSISFDRLFDWSFQCFMMHCYAHSSTDSSLE